MGINERGQVKVWLNTAFESTQVTGLRNVPEYEMLQDIFTLVYQSEDRESYPPNVPPLAEAIGIPDKAATFESVTVQFKDYAKKYTESFIPLSLQCVHSAGGAHLINDWCRTNGSYGFEQQSLRLSEKAYQSKIGKVHSSSVPAPAPEAREYVQQNPIDSQLANALGSRVNAQQPLFSITSQVQQQQQLERGEPVQMHQRYIEPQVFSRVNGQQPLFSITSQVQQQQQLERGQPVQLLHRVIEPQTVSQIIPQQQRIVQIIPQQYLPPQQIPQQVLPPQSIPQQVFISQAAPQQQVFVPSQPAPQQIPQQFPQQIRQQQINVPREQQVIYIPPQQVVVAQQPNMYSQVQPQY